VGIGTASPGAKLHVVGDVRVDGMLVGPMSIVSPHPDNPELELISASPIAGEASSFARGSGTMIAGEAIVNLPEHFALLTESEGLTVQLTARGRPLQLFVTELTTDRLVVHEANGASGSFDYLIQGIQRGTSGYQSVRVRNMNFVSL
jgi:hypothetical protein